VSEFNASPDTILVISDAETETRYRVMQLQICMELVFIK